MAKRVVLVTGSLAEPRVKRIVDDLNDKDIEPIVANVGVKVAALMTADIVERRLKRGDDREGVGRARQIPGNHDQAAIAAMRERGELHPFSFLPGRANKDATSF